MLCNHFSVCLLYWVGLRTISQRKLQFFSLHSRFFSECRCSYSNICVGYWPIAYSPLLPTAYLHLPMPMPCVGLGPGLCPCQCAGVSGPWRTAEGPGAMGNHRGVWERWPQRACADAFVQICVFLLFASSSSVFANTTWGNWLCCAALVPMYHHLAHLAQIHIYRFAIVRFCIYLFAGGGGG